MIDWKEKFINTEYELKSGKCVVIDYVDQTRVKIRLENGYKTWTNLTALRKGTVKTPFNKTCCGIGYRGIGLYGEDHPAHHRWNCIISRCYNPKDKDYRNYGAKGVTVCEEWHNFQNFAKWFDDNCKDPTYCMDKDLLSNGTKEYSPKYCCLLPTAINSILVDSHHGNLPYGVKKKIKRPGYEANIRKYGKRIYLGYFPTIEEAFAVYKEHKEAFIKELAEKYKDTISEEAYLALMNFTINIDD